MKLLLFRHSAARLQPPPGRGDADRPLSRTGREAMLTAAAVWARFAPIPDVICCSPYLRARQTADILAERFGAPPIRELPELIPDADAERVFKVLPGEETLCVVSHMPLCGDLLGMLAAGTDRASIPMAAGQGVLVDVPVPRVPSGRLLASLTTAEAERLA